MRILVITPYFYPHPGGSQRYIEELYGEVLRQHPDWEVDVLTYNTEKIVSQEKYRGMTIYRVGCIEFLRGQFALPNYFEIWRVLRKLKHRKYDVVNSHTRFFDNSWWAPLAAKYLGSKAVLTDHCAYHPAHKSGWVRKLAEGVDHVVIPLLSLMYNQVTVVSEATKRFLISHGMQREVQVVYGGVDPGSYKGMNVNRDNEVVIGFVGRMIPAKGPQLVVEAAKKLLGRYPKLRFVFAGDGELLTKLKKDESERMVFLGALDREKVVQLMKEMDICVLPSTHHEGLPSVILEAGAAGCAVVTTDRGGVREVIEEGKTGVIIEATVADLINKLEKLINDKELRRKLGKGLQKKVVTDYSWQRISEQYVKVLE
jgi:glycosyltransferase involved in cell wall biosynthesis